MTELLDENPTHFVNRPSVPLPITIRFGPADRGAMLSGVAPVFAELFVVINGRRDDFFDGTRDSRSINVLSHCAVLLMLSRCDVRCCAWTRQSIEERQSTSIATIDKSVFLVMTFTPCGLFQFKAKRTRLIAVIARGLVERDGVSPFVSGERSCDERTFSPPTAASFPDNVRDSRDDGIYDRKRM